MADDPLQHRAFADAIVERAATQLRELLVRLAREAQPFPPFPGAMFVYGIEVEPPPGSPHGCVILMDDGALYELQIGLDEDAVARGGDQVATRHEATVKLELPSDEYVLFAHRAALAVVAVLEARVGSAP
ncbi:MAG: hypothetical protein O3B31_15560 [Chloroflexi bacterium]|nr:hypothetical protein [Chloroflexota bacterium]MDA1004740.1 hypothetical protein [Chloroflexota bacterium]